MLLLYLICLFISYSHECAPTSPVGTTTISPNVSTTTLSPNVTTSPVETSTAAANVCCSWPFAAAYINTISPLQSAWNGCNQTLSYSCANTNGSLTAVALAVDWTTETANNLTNSQIALSTRGRNLNATLLCDPNTHLWAIDSLVTGQQHYLYACAYLSTVDNITWSVGRS